VGSVPSHPVRPVPRRRDAPLGASYAASVIRPLVIAAAVAVFAVAVAVAIEGQTGTDLVARSSVTTAFARVGEPLTVRLDMAQADPGSPVNVIYVPQGLHAPQPPFEVDVFKVAGSAAEHARLVGSVAGPGTEVEQRKNVLLIFSSSVSDQRRERIVGALRSL
jgi:hypothetical protein